MLPPFLYHEAVMEAVFCHEFIASTFSGKFNVEAIDATTNSLLINRGEELSKR